MRRSTFFMCALVLAAMPAATQGQQATGKLSIKVRSDTRPVEQAEISAAGQTVLTDARGEAILELVDKFFHSEPVLAQ